MGVSVHVCVCLSVCWFTATACKKKQHEVEVWALVTDEQGTAANQSKDNGDMTSHRKGNTNLGISTPS